MTIVLHEDRPKYDLWLKALLAFTPTPLIVLGLLIYYGALPAEPEEARAGAIILFASAIFTLLLFWAILPRKYQILGDRIKIVLGGPFSFNIGFNTIKETRGAEAWKGLGYWGIRFATSTKNVVEIVRSKGMDVVISPSKRELFLEELNKAVAHWRISRGIKGDLSPA
jgi:hypothetical protein